MAQGDSVSPVPTDEQLRSMIVTGLTAYMTKLATELWDLNQAETKSLEKVEMSLLCSRILGMARALVIVLEE